MPTCMAEPAVNGSAWIKGSTRPFTSTAADSANPSSDSAPGGVVHQDQTAQAAPAARRSAAPQTR